MKKLKTQKGITLVALIITIVVLLILAVVSIGTVQNSGIIGHAQNAAGDFEQAKANEIDTLDKMEEILTDYSGESKKFTEEEKNKIKELLLSYDEEIWSDVTDNEKIKEIKFTLKQEYKINLDEAISFYDENGDNILYFHETKVAYMIDSIVEFDKETIKKLHEVYEFAVFLNEEINEEDYIENGSAPLKVNYKGEEIVGYWHASPWDFEYNGFFVWPTSYSRDNNTGKIDWSTLKYVGI